MKKSELFQALQTEIRRHYLVVVPFEEGRAGQGTCH
jgi:hypothetical protein